MYRLKTFTFLALLAVPLLMAACAPYEPRSTVRLDPETVSIPEYRDFLVELNKAVDEGIPREFTDREMDRFTRIHSRLDQLLARHETIDTMDQEERMQLFNLHEQLQGVVIGRQEDQIICRRAKQVGTNFRQTQCKTESQWQEEQRNAHHYLQSGIRSTMEGPRN